MIDGVPIEVQLDPIMRIDGSLFYAEVLCRPQLTHNAPAIFNWILSKHNAGKSALLDLLMAQKVCASLEHHGCRVGLNLTPTGAVIHGKEIIKILLPFKNDVVIEIVEWDASNYYTDPIFIAFFKEAQDLGFYLMLDDVGEGAFIDHTLIDGLEGNGIKANYSHIVFASAVKKAHQELVIEFAASIQIVQNSAQFGATAFQGDHPRSLIFPNLTSSPASRQ